MDAAFNVDAGNNDEFKAGLLPEATGDLRLSLPLHHDQRTDWLYADLNGPVLERCRRNPGKLTVSPSGDTTPPATQPT